jgi:hypothetical protein
MGELQASLKATEIAAGLSSGHSTTSRVQCTRQGDESPTVPIPLPCSPANENSRGTLSNARLLNHPPVSAAFGDTWFINRSYYSCRRASVW